MIKNIISRIETANDQSPISVEIFYRKGEKGFRAYFSAPIKAPKDMIAPCVEFENTMCAFDLEKPMYGTANCQTRESRMYMQCRIPEHQLGSFYGEKGVAEFKKLAFAHGL